MDRSILHCDLNNFYASVECLYNPDLRGKPVAVCGSQSTRHGIVLAKNYHAKKYGVATGEVIWQAKRKCPSLVVVSPNYSLYLKFSGYAMDIYKRYTDLIEPFGIDECWLDVSGSTRLFGSGDVIGERIKGEIKKELGITGSVGVSYNKVFAKMGSDLKKPDGLTLITRDNFKDVLWPLPVRELFYVGKSTEKKLKRLGIYTIGNLAQSPLSMLTGRLGKWGETLWIFANGYEDMAVAPFNNEPVIKGIGNSLTTPKDLVTDEDVKILLCVLSESVGFRLRSNNLKGKTLQIGIRDSELEYITRQAPLSDYTYISGEIFKSAFDLFKRSWGWDRSIRLLGLRITDLACADTHIQLSFFFEDQVLKKQLLEQSMDKIRARFGYYSVQRALLLTDGDLNRNPQSENVVFPLAYFGQNQ